MAKRYRVTLSSEERELLNNIIQTRSSKSPQVRRSYMLLAADENGEKQWTDEKIKTTYDCSIPTIERLRKRFVEESLEIALYGKKREPIKDKLIDGRVEAKLVALRCSEPPEGYQQWSLRLLADRMVALEYVEHISYESVRKLLKKHHKALESKKLGNTRGRS
jgi:hypothetical protein